MSREPSKTMLFKPSALYVIPVILLGVNFGFIGKSTYAGGTYESHQEVNNRDGATGWQIYRPSLFQNVPPTVNFVYWNASLRHLEELRNPSLLELKEHLIWGGSTEYMNRIARLTGLNVLPPLNHSSLWLGLIHDGGQKRAPDFEIEKILKEPYQKYNLIPGSQELAEKEKLHSHLQRMRRKFGPADFNFMFETYALPGEYNEFKKAAQSCAESQAWILKPNKGFNSKGVRIFGHWHHVPKNTRGSIVQKYMPVEDQFTIDGKRAEIRLYLVTTSVNPLRVYHCEKQTVKVFLESPKWSHTSEDKQGIVITRAEFMWEGAEFYKYLKAHQNYSGVEDLMDTMEDMALKALILGQDVMALESSRKLFNNYNVFQIWTVDFILHKETIQPELLEVNRHGSLKPDTRGMKAVILPFLTNLMNLLGFHFPPTIPEDLLRSLTKLNSSEVETLTFDERLYNVDEMSAAEREKIDTFNRMDRKDYLDSILENLLPRDLRTLIAGEDELARMQGIRRIFPTLETHKYLKYMESDTYLFKLQDAWETKFAGDRSQAIKILREHARSKEHLRFSK